VSGELTLLTALIVGVLGSVHCVGMCGGIVGALTLGLAPQQRRSVASLLPYLALYNLGRIASYAIAGAIAGGLSAQLLDVLAPERARAVTLLVTGVFMVLLGLYLGGWWPALGVLERWGGGLWRRIEPLGRRLLPVRRPIQALGVGLLWGWLPCGLVYSALVWALASGSAAEGAALMVAFGLGTLPMLLAVGAAAERLQRLTRTVWVRQAAGMLVLGFGVYTIASLWFPALPAGVVHSH
jgi:hypothetical protein